MKKRLLIYIILTLIMFVGCSENKQISDLIPHPTSTPVEISTFPPTATPVAICLERN